MNTSEDPVKALSVWAANIANISDSLKRSMQSILKVIEVIPARLNSRVLEFHRFTSIPYYSEHFAYFSPVLRGEVEEIMRQPMFDFAQLEKMAVSDPQRRALKRKTAENLIKAYDGIRAKIAQQLAAPIHI